MSTAMEARVEAGAKLLDRVRPGWAELISLDELAMESRCDCILSQVYGGYDAGLDDLCLDTGINWGFDVLSPEVSHRTLEVVFAEFRELAGLWREQVAGRLGPKGGAS